MSTKVYHNKLVRDGIPQKLEGKSVLFDVRYACSAEMTGLLLAKLMEELEDLGQEEAFTPSWLSELVDVMDVLDSLAQRTVKAKAMLSLSDKRKRFDGIDLEEIRKDLFLTCNYLRDSTVYGFDWSTHLTHAILMCERLSSQSTEVSNEMSGIRQEKTDTHGGFSQGIVLLWTQDPEE